MAERKTDDISLQELLAARVHFGHLTKRWNPRMKKFIYTKQSGIHIIDLILTRKALVEARNFLSKVKESGGKVLMLGTKKQARSVVKKWAEKTGCYYLIERWPGGLFTNFGQVQRGLQKLNKLKELKGTPQWQKLTTRHQYLLLREIAQREKLFGGVAGMDSLPQALVVVDPKKERKAIKEAFETKVPVVAIIDTDGNPLRIDYPIPANEDASRAIDLVLGLAVAPLMEKEPQALKKEDIITTEDKKESPATAIADADLPKKAKSALMEAGYKTVEDLRKLTQEELEGIDGVGKKTAERIRSLLD